MIVLEESKMFGDAPLLSDEDITQYAESLTSKSDDDLIEETLEQVSGAGFFSRFSTYDQRARVCLAESERRQKPWLYQRGYNKALHASGQKVDDLDLERAQPSYYEKEDA